MVAVPIKSVLASIIPAGMLHVCFWCQAQQQGVHGFAYLLLHDGNKASAVDLFCRNMLFVTQQISAASAGYC